MDELRVLVCMSGINLTLAVLSSSVCGTSFFLFSVSDSLIYTIHEKCLAFGVPK